MSENLNEIYLDNSATTRPCPEALRAMTEAFESAWYNPSALYKPAMEVQKRVEKTREVCLKAAGAPGQKLVFTGSGTEADNLALLGFLRVQISRAACCSPRWSIRPFCPVWRRSGAWDTRCS